MHFINKALSCTEEGLIPMKDTQK